LDEFGSLRDQARREDRYELRENREPHPRIRGRAAQRPQTPTLPWSNPVEADAQMMQDLPVLEDHDLLSNFEPLKELPQAVQAEEESETQQQM